MDNVILIGMPGAGKSTVGVVLAKAMGRDFVDTDLLLQKREGLLLQEIIDTRGIDEFLRIEEEIIQDFKEQGCVVATGGSVVYSREAMKHLRSMGTVVYLQLPLEIIARRLNNMESRGIAIPAEQSLSELHHQRTPLYENYAHVILDCAGRDVESIVEAIRRKTG